MVFFRGTETNGYKLVALEETLSSNQILLLWMWEDKCLLWKIGMLINRWLIVNPFHLNINFVFRSLQCWVDLAYIMTRTKIDASGNQPYSITYQCDTLCARDLWGRVSNTKLPSNVVSSHMMNYLKIWTFRRGIESNNHSSTCLLLRALLNLVRRSIERTCSLILMALSRSVCHLIYSMKLHHQC